MGASRRDMLDVVLDETDGPDPAPAPGVDGAASLAEPPSHPPRGSGRARLRRARRWWPVAAVLTLAVVATVLVTDHRENLRMAALARVPGVLAPVDHPLAELWRSDGTQVVAALAGRLLAVVHGPDGGVDVAGLERTTGATAWRAAARAAGAVDLGTSCALTAWIGPADDASRPALACVVVDAVTNSSDGTFGEQSYPSSARLLVVDATSGAVLADGPTDPSTTVSADAAGLVVSRVTADGRVTVTASDAVGAPDRWTFTSPEPLAADPFGHRYAWAVATGRLVIVGSFAMTDQGSTGSSWVLSDDGTVLRAVVADTSTGFAAGLSVLLGGRALAEPGVGDSGQSTTTVTDLASGRSFTADALDPVTRPDDGSLGDLLLLQSPTAGDVIGYDLATGRPRWTSPSPGGAGTGVIDGRVLRADSRRLTSIDGRSGETVWSTPLTPADAGAAIDWTTSGSLLTDGRLVLVTEPGAAGLRVAAYGLDDGRERWATTLPGVQQLYVVDGSPFGWSNQGLVALG